MGVLPGQEAALGVGHERKVAPIHGTQRCYAVWGAIRVGWVGLCGGALRVTVPATRWGMSGIAEVDPLQGT